MKFRLLGFLLFASTLVFGQTKEANFLSKAQNFKEQGIYDSALVYYNRACDYYLAIGDTLNHVYALTSFAEFQRFLVKLPEAKEKIDSAEDLSEKILVPPAFLGYLYGRKAAILSELRTSPQDLVSAYADMAYQQAAKAQDTILMATSLNEIGFVLENKDRENCFDKYKKALKLFKAKNDTDGFLLVCLNLARAYHHHAIRDSGRVYAEMGINLPTFYQDIRKNEHYYFYAEILRHQGFHKEAYAALHKHHELEYLKNLDGWNSNLAKMERQLKLKEKENELLKKQDSINKTENELNSERRVKSYAFVIIFILLALLGPIIYFNQLFRRKNKLLMKLSKENNFLVRESNHRIKNNLQLISSIINKKLKVAQQDELTQLREISTKIESIAGVHKQLYTNNELESIWLKPYLENLIAGLGGLLTKENVAIACEFCDVQINAKKATYLGLLINELIVNSLKHAFKDSRAKIIKIKLNRDDQNFYLTYKDSGTGLGNANIKMVKLLTSQLGGYFTRSESDYQELNFTLKL
ncbi:sensor histidine kinase [Luteibaculum oceani]|uniref:histidine kinase n=1 Tax=Luteibaculum oceani TaxID=1294296 RepID=A0A5C6V1E3_9FLAO|nr:sensor histidine kinase [Luteibaculum oceani]TXC78670.1 sensor histidine kinase [Luteibaculum oceani]